MEEEFNNDINKQSLEDVYVENPLAFDDPNLDGSPVIYGITEEENNEIPINEYQDETVHLELIGESWSEISYGAEAPAAHYPKPPSEIYGEIEEGEMVYAAHEVASDQQQTFLSPVASEVDQKRGSEMTEGNIFELKKAGSDNITKVEGDPKPFGFIESSVLGPSETQKNKSLHPQFDEIFTDMSQLGGPGELIPGTGERNPNIDPAKVLTKEEMESYILNFHGIEDNEESEKHRQQMMKLKRDKDNIDYLKTEVGVAIKQALAEIVRIQPKDPIHYLGHWLFKWRYNQKSHQKEIKTIKELACIRGFQSKEMIGDFQNLSCHQ